ncbi:MAG: sugar phosphate nucleotidyltransferase [Nitrospiraceae bacterium]
MKQGEGRGNLWSIVLAGGDGVRTQELVRRWLGAEKPKQYCAFVGSRSMFQHTIDRAALLTPPEHVVVVAGRHHQREVWSQLEGRAPGLVLLQPENLDTAAGVFLPLTYILARDPGATVAIFPSDHFVYPEDRFLEKVEQALRGSALLFGRPVLLAAKPDSLELEYGWIQPGKRLAWTGTDVIRAVHSFVEKPDEALTRMVMATRALWNTMVLVAKAEQLWDLGEMCSPKMMRLFQRLRDAIDTPEELRVLDAIYGVMPRKNFSSHLLQCKPERLAVMEMREVLWSDWGHPKRIVQTLEKIGTRPAFAEEHLPALQAG